MGKTIKGGYFHALRRKKHAKGISNHRHQRAVSAILEIQIRPERLDALIRRDRRRHDDPTTRP